VARAHAEALEPKLTRLELRVAPTLRGRSEVSLDGERMPVEAWNLAWPVDPGDHVITVSTPGQAPRTFRAVVEVGAPPVTLRIDDPDASSVAAGPLAAAPQAPAPPVDLPPPALAPSPDRVATRRWASLVLAAAGVVGLGVEAACLVAKNHSMSNGGPSGSPHEDDGAAVGSALGFVGGGAALVSAVVLYLTAPAAQEGAWRATPAPLLGGAGVFLGTLF
jgi:hypothetical protein